MDRGLALCTIALIVPYSEFDRRVIDDDEVMRNHPRLVRVASVQFDSADQPNVNEKALRPGSRKSISNLRSAIGLGCRISWYHYCPAIF